MTLLPEVREELVATAARRAASTRGRRPRRRLRGWLPRFHLRDLAVVLSVGVTLAVAIVAVVLLGHRRMSIPPPSHPDSSSALTSLPTQSGRLLGSTPELLARVRALRGYPIVINAWASWCSPCRAEFGRFASAAARDGRQVAFLGADFDDTPSAGRSFLAQHPVSYPSYLTTNKQLDSSLPVAVQGLPMTIFIDRAGKVVYTHLGEYGSLAAIQRDIAVYLGPKTPASPPSSTRALIAELGILRQPQTAQARAFNTSRVVKHNPPQAPPQQLISSLTRLVTLPDGGKLFLYVAPLVSRQGVYGLGYHEMYPSYGAGGCCLTTSVLRKLLAPSPDQTGTNREATYFEIVPDGVARVRWVFPRRPTYQPGTHVAGAPTLPFAKALTVNIAVHDNVAAIKLPQHGTATLNTWYAADGHVIARYTAPRR